MLKDPFFKRSFLALLVVGILDQVGVRFSLFDIYWWYDILLHFLGGLWLGFTALWIYNTQSFVRKLIKTHKPMILSVGLAIIVGVLWEIFEYNVGLTHNAFMSYPLDTAKDLFDDTLGGIVAGLAGAKYFLKINGSKS